MKEEALALLNLSLEEKLQATGLIQEYQLEIARMEQSTCRKEKSLAQILIEKKWVKAETIHFFETLLLQPANRRKDRPIETYLGMAGLLDRSQLEELRHHRNRTGISVTESAESRGWIDRKTVNFINACLNM